MIIECGFDAGFLPRDRLPKSKTCGHAVKNQKKIPCKSIDKSKIDKDAGLYYNLWKGNYAIMAFSNEKRN